MGQKRELYPAQRRWAGHRGYIRFSERIFCFGATLARCYSGVTGVME